jgi:alkyldihydroxyacetonephosphate synthase
MSMVSIATPFSPATVGALRAAAGQLFEEGPGLRAAPATVEAAAETVAEAAGRGIPVVLGGPGPGALLLDRTRLDGVGPVDEEAMWIRAEAGARLTEVEVALRGRGLTLGSQPPSVLPGGTVASWLEGPLAGRRAEDGRIGPAAAAVEAVLPDGTLYRGRAAPRTGAGPGIVGLLLGGGGAAGTIVAATLKAQPVAARREHLAARGTSADVAGLLPRLLALPRLPAELELRVEEGGAVLLAVTLHGEREEVERERDRYRTLARGAGLLAVEPPGQAAIAPAWEWEVERRTWAAAIAALPAGARLRVVRIAREAAIAVGAPAVAPAMIAPGIRLLGGEGAAPFAPAGPGAALFERIVRTLRRTT